MPQRDSISIPAGFRFIDEYNIAKDLETDDFKSKLDQQVPQFRQVPIDMKRHIKLEQTDDQSDFFIRMMADSMLIGHSNSIIYPSSNSNNSCKYNFSSTNNQNKCAPPVSTQSPVSFSDYTSPLTTSASCMPQLTHSNASTDLRYSSSFQAKYSPPAGQFGGNSGSVLTNTDYFLPGVDVQEDSLELTDLDKQQVSIYDGFDFLAEPCKVDESKRLEEAAAAMLNTVYIDCERLKIPCDPQMWTPENVLKWVSWVCERNGVTDVPSQLGQYDGPTICSFTEETFCYICGHSGIKISNELELWKTANSFFQSQNICINNNIYTDSPGDLNITRGVSPALSSCSSNHDSNTSTFSAHSDHSDDECTYATQLSLSSTPVALELNGYKTLGDRAPTGRGHKQTIHLWQFLKELLLSKDSKYNDCIRWLDRKNGIFKIEDSKKVATLWGARKNRPAMNYDKLSRSVRQYYKKGIIKKTEQSKRLVYQFCPAYM